MWGNKFIENLAADIKLAFPDTTGYSVRNLKYMAKFAALFPDIKIVQSSLAQISWYHNMALMDKVKDERAYFWYASEAAKNGWSRNVLVHQIERELYERQAIEERVQEERIIYARLHAITGNFIVVYVVDPKTSRYREFDATNGYVEV